jgi:hypothetical protein
VPRVTNSQGDRCRCCKPSSSCINVQTEAVSNLLPVLLLLLQAPLDSIKGAVHALGPAVELGQVFGGLPAGAPYHLR